ncbi:MAG: amidohydrolase family protein [Flavonifractor plautii]
MSILIHNCTAVLMDEAGTVLPNAYVVVEGTKIRSVSTQRPWGSFEEQIDGQGNVLMPGFVNAHSHVPMTAMRGYGDGNNLQDWLHNYIFPVEARWDDRAIRACTDLGLAEMIASGVTTIADMYGHTDAVAQEVAASGISANLCCGGVQFTDTFDPRHPPRLCGAAGADREVARLQRRADSGGRLHPRRVHLPPPALAVDGGLRPGARPGYARAHLRDPHRA